MENSSGKKLWGKLEDEKLINFIKQNGESNIYQMSDYMGFSYKTVSRHLSILGLKPVRKGLMNIYKEPIPDEECIRVHIDTPESESFSESTEESLETFIKSYLTKSKKKKVSKPKEKEPKDDKVIEPVREKFFFRIKTNFDMIITVVYYGITQEEAENKLYENHKCCMDEVLSITKLSDMLSLKSDFLHGRKEDL